jgi:hypothetical protein
MSDPANFNNVQSVIKNWLCSAKSSNDLLRPDAAIVVSATGNLNLRPHTAHFDGLVEI